MKHPLKLFSFVQQVCSQWGLCAGLSLMFMVFTGGIGTLAVAQSVIIEANQLPTLTNSQWFYTTSGVQHAKLLRSRDPMTREKAMQNIIVLGTNRPGEFNFLPAVPLLVDIYSYSNNQAHRMMAVAAVHAIGDRYGMDQLFKASLTDHSRYTRQFAQNAVRSYYATSEMERYQVRADRYRAAGRIQKADRNDKKADRYRQLLLSSSGGSQ